MRIGYATDVDMPASDLRAGDTARHAPNAAVSFAQPPQGFAPSGTSRQHNFVDMDWLNEQVRQAVDSYMAELAPNLGSGLIPAQTDETVVNANSLLSITEIATKLHISDQTVRNREAQNELFSILAPARKRGREYPAFQIMEGIQGAPLRQILGELRDVGNADKFQFFTAPNFLLGDLTPVRTLVAKPIAASSERAAILLKQSSQFRLEAVLKAASTFVATLEAS